MITQKLSTSQTKKFCKIFAAHLYTVELLFTADIKSAVIIHKHFFEY